DYDLANLALGQDRAALAHDRDFGTGGNADSAGLALLLEWVTWANHTVREINYLNVPQRVTNIASISEVDGLLNAAERWRGFL
ncbi:MAG: hypothetical protein AAGJ86_13305, partial [Pseudomonadota bacterium]